MRRSVNRLRAIAFAGPRDPMRDPMREAVLR